jgi:hypothetical protein
MSSSRDVVQVLRRQKRPLLLALALAVGSFWIAAPLGYWQIGLFLSIGFLLGLVHHVLTELALLKSVGAEASFTRSEFATSAFVRLLAVSAVALALAVIFWSDGVTTLFGLAIFRLLTIVLTGLPLLRELRKV